MRKGYYGEEVGGVLKRPKSKLFFKNAGCGFTYGGFFKIICTRLV
jgi:hypothetical protein